MDRSALSGDDVDVVLCLFYSTFDSMLVLKQVLREKAANLRQPRKPI
jgi:hypothetical protein